MLEHKFIKKKRNIPLTKQQQHNNFLWLLERNESLENKQKNKELIRNEK